MEVRVATIAGLRLNLPHCRFCGRKWSPREHVSANLAYCEECRDERLAFTQSKVSAIRVVRGGNGERVMLPIKR